jgi:hypothetical protein
MHLDNEFGRLAHLEHTIQHPPCIISTSPLHNRTAGVVAYIFILGVGDEEPKPSSSLITKAFLILYF